MCVNQLPSIDEIDHRDRKRIEEKKESDREREKEKKIERKIKSEWKIVNERRTTIKKEWQKSEK